jgi:hypothetical protein
MVGQGQRPSATVKQRRRTSKPGRATGGHRAEVDDGRRRQKARCAELTSEGSSGGTRKTSHNFDFCGRHVAGSSSAGKSASGGKNLWSCSSAFVILSRGFGTGTFANGSSSGW